MASISTTSTTRVRIALAAASAALLTLGLAGCGDDSGDSAAGDSDSSTTRSTSPGGPGGTDDPTSEPTKQAPSTPPSTGASEIPPDFPLTSGLPATNGDDGTPVEVTDRPGVMAFTMCGTETWSPRDTVDLAGAKYTGEAEDFRSRTLALYPDQAAARAAFKQLRATVAACPDETVRDTDQLYDVVTEGPGRVTYSHQYRYDGRVSPGLEVLEVVQVGPALYLASYYNEGGGPYGDIEKTVRRAEHDSAEVVTAMADL